MKILTRKKIEEVIEKGNPSVIAIVFLVFVAMVNFIALKYLL